MCFVLACGTAAGDGEYPAPTAIGCGPGSDATGGNGAGADCGVQFGCPAGAAGSGVVGGTAGAGLTGPAPGIEGGGTIPPAPMSPSDGGGSGPVGALAAVWVDGADGAT